MGKRVQECSREEVRSSGTLGFDVARDASLSVLHLAGPKCRPTKLLGHEAGKESATRNATVRWHRFRCAIIYAYGEGLTKVDNCLHVGAKRSASPALNFRQGSKPTGGRNQSSPSWHRSCSPATSANVTVASTSTRATCSRTSWSRRTCHGPTQGLICEIPKSV